MLSTNPINIYNEPFPKGTISFSKACKGLHISYSTHKKLCADIRAALMDSNILHQNPEIETDQITINLALEPVLSIYQDVLEVVPVQWKMDCLRNLAQRAIQMEEELLEDSKFWVPAEKGEISPDARIQVLCNGRYYFIHPHEIANKTSPRDICSRKRFYKAEDLSFRAFKRVVEQKIECSLDGQQHTVSWSGRTGIWKTPTGQSTRCLLMWRLAIQEMLEMPPILFRIHQNGCFSEGLPGRQPRDGSQCNRQDSTEEETSIKMPTRTRRSEENEDGKIMLRRALSARALKRTRT